jgi:hypothetical protein
MHQQKPRRLSGQTAIMAPHHTVSEIRGNDKEAVLFQFKFAICDLLSINIG